jgi:hypothetical protein
MLMLNQKNYMKKIVEIHERPVSPETMTGG